MPKISFFAGIVAVLVSVGVGAWIGIEVGTWIGVEKGLPPVRLLVPLSTHQL